MRFSFPENTLRDCSEQRDRAGSLLNSWEMLPTSYLGAFSEPGLALSNRATGLTMKEDRDHGEMKGQANERASERERDGRKGAFSDFQYSLIDSLWLWFVSGREKETESFI